MIVESRRGAYYSIRYAINLSNKYAKRLYYLFQDRKNWNLKNPDMETGVFTIAIEELLRMLDCPKSYKYTDFKRYVIKPSMEQINGSTDIYFEYEENRGKLKSGQKGVLSLTFHVTQLNPNSKVVADAAFYEITSQHVEIRKRGYLDAEVRDILSMAKRYDRDDNFIQEALEIVDHTKCESRVGLACYFMKNGYNQLSSSRQLEKGTNLKVAERSASYHNFHQRNYDYDELEKNLLNQSIATEKQKSDEIDEQKPMGKREISFEELQSMMAGNPQLQQEIASLLEKMNGTGQQ